MPDTPPPPPSLADPLKLDDDMIELLQEILNAITELPDVWPRVEAYLIGRGVDDPREKMGALRELVF